MRSDLSVWRVLLKDEDEGFVVEAVYLVVQDGQFIFFDKGLKLALATDHVAEITRIYQGDV